MQFRTLTGVGLAALPLLACNTMDFPIPVHSRSHLERNEATRLLMFDSGAGPQNRDWQTVDEAMRAAYVHGGDVPLETARDLVATACAPPPAPTAQERPRPGVQVAPAVLAAPLIGAAVNFVASGLKTEIDRWASSYEAHWSARRSDEFYAAAPEGDIRAARFAHSCFAVMREVGPPGERQMAFLHIGRLVASRDHIAVRIEPLLHAHPATKARVGSGGSFNAAMVITVQGVWVDLRHAPTAARDVVFTAALDFPGASLNRPAVRVYANVDERREAASTWFPFVPVSMDRNGNFIGTGPVNITATVAETARARDLAAAAARQANNLVDQIAAQVAEALAAQR